MQIRSAASTLRAVALQRPLCAPTVAHARPLPSHAVSSCLPTGARRPLSVSRPARRTETEARTPRISYEELRPLAKSPTGEVLLIDVREPSEFVQGSIPSSVNLPLSELQEALELQPADFQRKHTFRKPAPDQKIVLYCLAGIRAETAAQEFKRRGYKHLQNYEGSYQEWRQREGGAVDDDD